MDKVRLGFCGFRHDHIISLYRLASQKAGVEIAGAFEDNEKGIARAKGAGIEITYGSYAELLSDPAVDAVAIGDVYGARGARVIAALEAGKHVISDKPLCVRKDELERIRALSVQKRLAVCLMLDLRDNPNVRRALALVRDGEIGEINNVRFNGMHPLNYGVRPAWYFEKGAHGGVINDLAIHGVDLVRLFTGSDIKRVLAARCWNFYADREPGFRDSAQFMLETESGAGVLADVSYSLPKYGFDTPTYWEFELCGSKGLMRFSFGSDGVAVYGDTEKRYAGIDGGSDYLDLFLEDVTAGTRHTDEYLKSAEQTLMIQLAAE